MTLRKFSGKWKIFLIMRLLNPLIPQVRRKRIRNDFSLHREKKGNYNHSANTGCKIYIIV
jgi:hypothetical protein